MLRSGEESDNLTYVNKIGPCGQAAIELNFTWKRIVRETNSRQNLFLCILGYMIDPVLKQFISKIYPLNDEELLVLQHCFKPQQTGKKEFIIKEGQVTKQLFFIKSGVYRGYYVKDIEEITLNFYFGPTFYADIVSIHDNTPTRYNVQALEAGEVWCGDIRKIEELGQEYPSVLRLFIRFYEIVYSFGQKRQLSFIFDSAEERYLNLFNERPKVISQIPLAYIASYLGIQPESLSRIRKKIAR